MQLKKIKIGGVYTPNNIFLAPLAGYTNAVFREMCFGFGAGLTFTEMVSAKGLFYGNEKTADLLKVTENYGGVKACQIFGNDPYYMRLACESSAISPFEIVDINMGCPVPKIFKNGEGSALMNDFKLASSIISACKKSGKAITVKFRIGLDKDHICAVEFAKMCEDSGADMICVHGRTRDKIYSGEVDFAAIAEVRNAVKIPVIANGGVFSKADAKELLAKTGADGIAVARGAMYKPWIFAEITGAEDGDRKNAVLRQLELTRKLYGERFACVYMRKMTAFYLHGMPDAVKFKQRLFSAATTEEVEEIINEINF